MSKLRELHRQYEAAEEVRVNCGVYVRSKSFERWLKEQLDAANQRIAALEDQVKELTVPEGLTWGQLVDAGFVSARMDRLKAAKEAAERKLATAITALGKADDLYAYAIGAMNSAPGRENQLRCANEAIAILNEMRHALAQIEQPKDNNEPATRDI